MYIFKVLIKTTLELNLKKKIRPLFTLQFEKLEKQKCCQIFKNVIRNLIFSTFKFPK